MLISHLKKFIYAKTSKTASTSVESYFEEYCMPEGEWEFQRIREAYVNTTGVIGYRGNHVADNRWFNHMPAAKIRAQMNAGEWDDYFKFAVIRNPFDKLVSLFFFHKRQTGLEKQLVASFRDWLRSGGGIVDRPIYTIDGEICMDYFIRYENLEAGIEYVCQHIGVPFRSEKLPRLKSGIRDHSIALEAFYDDETIAIVEKKYEFELAYFGYQL